MSFFPPTFARVPGNLSCLLNREPRALTFKNHITRTHFNSVKAPDSQTHCARSILELSRTFSWYRWVLLCLGSHDYCGSEVTLKCSCSGLAWGDSAAALCFQRPCVWSLAQVKWRWQWGRVWCWAARQHMTRRWMWRSSGTSTRGQSTFSRMAATLNTSKQ